MGFKILYSKTIKKLNLRKAAEEKKPNSYLASCKNELHPYHSFRNFRVTQMARSRVDNVTREGS